MEETFVKSATEAKEAILVQCFIFSVLYSVFYIQCFISSFSYGAPALGLKEVSNFNTCVYDKLLFIVKLN